LFKTDEKRERTKGKFEKNTAHGARTNFIRDVAWMKKANPEAA